MIYLLKTGLILFIFGQARVFDARGHPELVEKVLPLGGHGAKVGRVFTIDIPSYDWNCLKFITPRYTAAEVQRAATPLHQYLAGLEPNSRCLKWNRNVMRTSLEMHP